MPLQSCDFGTTQVWTEVLFHELHPLAKCMYTNSFFYLCYMNNPQTPCTLSLVHPSNTRLISLSDPNKELMLHPNVKIMTGPRFLGVNNVEVELTKKLRRS